MRDDIRLGLDVVIGRCSRGAAGPSELGLGSLRLLQCEGESA